MSDLSRKCIVCRFFSLTRPPLETRRGHLWPDGAAPARLRAFRGGSRGSIPGPPRRWAGLRRPSGSQTEPEQVRGQVDCHVTLHMP